MGSNAGSGRKCPWGETLEQGTKPPTASRAPQFRLPTAPLGCVKCREHISLHIILCIIVYVTNKAHLSLICCWERALSRSCDQRLPTIIFWQCQKFSITHSVFAAMIHIYWPANKKATWISTRHCANTYSCFLSHPLLLFSSILKTTAAKSHLDIISHFVHLHANNACTWCCWRKTSMRWALFTWRGKQCARVVVLSILVEYLIWRRRIEYLCYFCFLCAQKVFS